MILEILQKIETGLLFLNLNAEPFIQVYVDAVITSIEVAIQAQGGPTSSLDITQVEYEINGQSFRESGEGVHLISINRTPGYHTHMVPIKLFNTFWVYF